MLSAMTIEKFEDIEGWKLARELCQRVYCLADGTSLGRDYSLKDQVSRSSGSIMDNIAEGFDSGTNPEFVRFLQYSKRSCSELQSQPCRCLDRKHCVQSEFEVLYEMARLCRSKIGSFINYLERHPTPRRGASRRLNTGEPPRQS
jgi:four helix bundle protein